jgi:hypothetical protein
MRGLNKSVRSYRLRDDELKDATNVRIGLSGEVYQRPGVEESHDMLSNNECRGLWRYARTDGVREWVCFRNGNVDGDGNGTAPFVNITTQTASADGYLRFGQWKDTVALCSDAADHKWYNSGDATDVRTADQEVDIDIAALNFGFVKLTAGTASGGTLEELETYYYRFTIDVEMDGDYLGETKVVIDNGLGSPGYQIVTGTTTASNKTLTILKNSTDNLPTHFARINVYRTEAPDATDLGVFGTNFSMWHVGTISKATFDAAADSAVIFTDDGLDIDADRQLKARYYSTAVMPFKPPQAKQFFRHKQRAMYVKGSSIFFSEINEPEAVRTKSELFIQKAEGEDIVLAVSWYNKFILVFEPNTSWIIGGGDLENELTLEPDYFQENLSPAIGCIAPDSFAFVDNNAVWLSNQGVMWFDGTRIRDLQTDQIREYLDEIPITRKYYASGTFNRKERQYWLFVTPTGGSSNTLQLVYDFRTQSWVEGQYENNSQAFGYNLTTEVAGLGAPGTGEGVEVWGANDFTGGAQTTHGSLHKFNEVEYDRTDDSNGGITWSVESGDSAFGEPEMLKEYGAVVVTYYSDVDITATITVDDGVDTESWTLPLASPLRQKTHVEYLDTDTLEHGSRCRVKFAANSRARPEIQDVVVFWAPKGYIVKDPDA